MGKTIRMALCHGVILGGAASVLAGFAASSPVRDLTVSTESGAVLESQVVSLPFDFSEPATLSFSFGYETDEVLLPGVFSDALSLGLFSDSQAWSFPFASADAGGVTWAPQNPDGPELDPDAIVREQMAPRFGPESYQSSLAYSVSVPVPGGLGDVDVDLYLDLVDNGNGIRSIGWIDELRLDTEIGPPELALYSANSLEGPFWLETDAIFDPVAKEIRVPLVRPQTFYRVRSSDGSRVTAIRRVGDEWELSFEPFDLTPLVWRGGQLAFVLFPVAAEEVGLGLWQVNLPMNRTSEFLRFSALPEIGILSFRLQGDALQVILGQSPIEVALQAEGPYRSAESILRVTGNTLHLPIDANHRFVRANPRIPWRVQSVTLENEEMLVTLEEREVGPTLLAATIPSGPFHPVTDALLQDDGTRFRFPATIPRRFLRLTGESQVIRAIQSEGEFLVIRYE